MPAQFKFGIGRCCCPACKIATNDFETDLSNMTGTGSLSGGSLILDTGESEVFNDGAATVGDATHLITFADPSASSGTVRLRIAEVDSNNYLFGEFAFAAGAGTIRLGERVSGSDSYLTAAVTVDDTGAELEARCTLALCWQPGAPQTSVDTAQGPLEPISVISATNWITPENLLVGGGGSSQYFCSGTTPTDAIRLGPYGFSLPPGATITSIQFALTGGHDGISADVDFYAVVLFFGGAEVSTTKGFGDPFNSGSSIYSYTWGAGEFGGLTWSDVNSTAANSLEVSVKFIDNDTGGAQLTVSDWLLSIFFTTADRGGGRLKIARTNTGAPQIVECSTALGVFSTGLKAGIQSIGGTWDFTEATYSYQQSLSRPSCPACNCQIEATCTVCCDETIQPFGEYTINFGAGGLTDEECGFCDEWAGVFTLTEFLECRWIYVIFNIDMCVPATCTPDYRIDGYQFFLQLVSDGIDCRWRLELWIFGNVDLFDPNPACRPGALAAVYESAVIATNECRTMPVTLTKIAEYDRGVACSGTNPNTITLDVP